MIKTSAVKQLARVNNIRTTSSAIHVLEDTLRKIVYKAINIAISQNVGSLKAEHVFKAIDDLK